MKITAEPRSDQWNADDFVQGPHTFSIADVKAGAAEQKYDIVLEGSDRVWRPPLTVLRILLSAWGDEASQWVGRRATLYRDDSIRFGPNEVGGIRVSHLSHIDKPVKVSAQDKRGSRKSYTVQPLVEAPAPPTIDPATLLEWADAIAAADTLPALQAVWVEAGNAKVTSHPAIIGAKDKRKTELQASS